MTSLVKKIDAATGKNSSDRMRSAVVFLSDEENAKDTLKHFATQEGIKDTILAIDNVAGPPGYHIAKEADITVVLYKKRKVESNFALKKGELTAAKIEQILADLPKILTKKDEPK